MAGQHLVPIILSFELPMPFRLLSRDVVPSDGLLGPLARKSLSSLEKDECTLTYSLEPFSLFVYFVGPKNASMLSRSRPLRLN